MNKINPVLNLKQVSYKYPNSEKYVLKNISFSMDKGEVVGIMGNNGAGKTTLIKTLNGLIRPSQGKIFFMGDDISSKTTASLSKKIGLVFQNPNHQLFSNTVEDEIKFSLKNTIKHKENMDKIISDTLVSFDLDQYKTRSPLNLSGGEMKKLSIASIICRDPEVLIFDEPTIGQDAKSMEFFINLLTQERDNNKSIIIITHDTEFALEHLPRILLMKDGEIIADGPTKHVLNNKTLIAEASLILPQVSRLKESLITHGIDITKEIYLNSEMFQFLKEYLTLKGKK